MGARAKSEHHHGMKRRQILVAEDEGPIREGLIDALESEGYGVTGARHGREALGYLRQGGYHLAILDIMMPEVSGYDVCREIRKSDARLPILFLTAKGQEIDKVVGLELGADDYLTKPFGVRELLARVAALLRRAELQEAVQAGDATLPNPFYIGGAAVDHKQFRLEVDGAQEALTARELKLLQTFYRHPDEVLTRDALLNAVWGVDYLGTTRTLDQHVAQVRKKLGSAAGHLQTVHGVGYRYQER